MNLALEDQSYFQFAPSDIENTDTSNFDVSSFSCIYNKNVLFEVHGRPWQQPVTKANRTFVPQDREYGTTYNFS